MCVRLGYACISNVLRENDIYTGRTLMLKSVETKGITEAKMLAKQNVADLIKIIIYNEALGIRFFRITSNLFPHMNNPRTKESYDIDFVRPELAEAGRLARQYGHRITAHPSQFAQLGSPRLEVVKQTAIDLSHHADVFEAMGLSPELGTVMILHGGGSYGDKQKALERWAERYAALPKNVSRFIVLENDEYQYGVLDLLPFCEKLRVPLCVDFFHHEASGSTDDIYSPDIMTRVINTWRLRGIKPKFHWSNQAPGKRKGSHGRCIDTIPREIMDICKKYDVDLMIEAKDKDVCVLKIYPMYFYQVVLNGRVEWWLRN